MSSPKWKYCSRHNNSTEGHKNTNLSQLIKSDLLAMSRAKTSEIVQGDAKQKSAWYHVQCKPNAERVAFKNLRDKNFNAFFACTKNHQAQGKCI